MATDSELAASAEDIAQEALKKKKAEEEALLKAYSTGSSDLYDTAKSTSSDYLTGAKSDIQGLYDSGYSQLQSLIGEESAAAMKDLVRQNENSLSAKGLLGGPSGALNEALANSAGRVRTDSLNKLENYLNNKNSALTNVFSSTASQQSALEQAYAQQQQSLLAQAFQTNLDTANKGAELTDKYTTAGLEAALGTNKISVETAAQKDLAAEQAAINAEVVSNNLQARQSAWDNQYQSVFASLYSSYRSAGWPDAQATQNAKTETLKQIGPRPTA